jgi:hypothetical protein
LREFEYSAQHLSALLRLATKYDAQYLRTHVINHLNQIFPALPSIVHYDLAQSRRLCFDASDIIRICNVVNELKLDRLAASLTYTCAVDLSSEAIVEGQPSNGQTAELDAWPKRCALKVRNYVLQRIERLFSAWINDFHEEWYGCTAVTDCRFEVMDLKRIAQSLAWTARVNIPPWRLDDRVLLPADAKGFDNDPHHWGALSSRVKGLCEPCKYSFGAQLHRDARNNLGMYT